LGSTTQTYAYDTIGNLTSKAGVSMTYGANANGTGAGPHQARSIGGVTQTYDANGNLTSGMGRTIAWNNENLPSSVTSNGVTETYGYNADSLRVKKVRSGVTTIYLEGLWEQTSSGTTRRFYSLNGQVVAVRTNAGSTNTVSYLHGDHLGSISVTTTASGTAEPRQEFDPWGTVRSGGVTTTTRNYTGQILDDTGLLFYNARYYDPAIGRFISADTIVPGSNPLTVWPSDAVAGRVWRTQGSGLVNPQNLNRYTYVQNNPLGNTDPTGHCTVAVGIGFSAFAGIGIRGGLTFAIDGEGNFAILAGLGGGGYSSIGGGVEFSLSGTTAPTVYQLEGQSVQVGVSITAGPGAGAELEAFTDGQQDYFGGTVSVGVGAQQAPVPFLAPVGVHGTMVNDTIIAAGPIMSNHAPPIPDHDLPGAHVPPQRPAAGRPPARPNPAQRPAKPPPPQAARPSQPGARPQAV
jgi:RHS repeat-associated protein